MATCPAGNYRRTRTCLSARSASTIHVRLMGKVVPYFTLLDIASAVIEHTIL